MRLSFNLDLPGDCLRVGGYGDGGRFVPLLGALQLLTAINLWHWRRFGESGVTQPWLYDSGVRYEQEPTYPKPQEEWLDFPTLYKQGFGDCEDLACARAAELRYCGVDARPVIKRKPYGGFTLIHVLVMHPDGWVEDPSKILGMKGAY